VERQIMEASWLMSVERAGSVVLPDTGEANTTIEAESAQAASRQVDSFDAPGVVW